MTLINDDNENNDGKIQIVTIMVLMIIKLLLINEIMTIKDRLIVASLQQ